MLDTSTVGAPDWWMNRLLARLESDAPRLDRLQRYYDGDHDLPEGDGRARDAWLAYQRKARTNFTGLVVESRRERLRVTGFRTGSAGDDGTDQDAWRLWQANRLDAGQALINEWALSLSRSYAIVGNIGPNGWPVITAEDPRCVVVERDPVYRNVIRAAVKTWTDDALGRRYAVLFLPATIHYYEAPTTTVETWTAGDRRKVVDWCPWLTDYTPEGYAVNDLGQVPIVEFTPTDHPCPKAEHETAIDVQDRINDGILNRLVITKMQAYRQRWAKGIQTEDEDGNDLPLPFVPGVDLLWAVDDPAAEFGDFAATDIRPVLEGIRADVEHLAIVKALPPTYIQGDLVNVSSDTITAINDRLVQIVKDRQTCLGESYEQMMRLAFTRMGEPDRVGVDAEVVWADPERQSLAQKADAAGKAVAAGVPWRARMEMLGYSPTEIARMEADRTADVMVDVLAQPSAVG